MIKIIKNGVVVSVVLDTRTINKEGTYPVKIKVYYQGKPKYYSVGICLTSKEELEEALEGKSKECRDIQEEIGKEFSRILNYAPITPEMQSIIEKWGNNPRKSIYIFPFMKAGDDAWEHEKKKKNLTKHINDRMKVIGEKLNIGKITTYVARHTYATVLRNEGVPVSIISPMLGHTSITTTEIYLADLESENRARNASLLSF